VWGASQSALAYASVDRRARSLLHDALKARDDVLLHTAIEGLAAQRDHASLPAIRSALRSAGRPAAWLANSLADFAFAEADAVAFEFITEDRSRAQYRERRASNAPPTVPR